MDATKGSLRKAFLKIALVAGVALGTTGCVTTGMYPSVGVYGQNNAYGQTNTYGQQGNYGITYRPSNVPWASDPSYRQEIQLSMQQANQQVRLLQSNYTLGVSNCNTRFSQDLLRNRQYNERARRDGTSFQESMASGARLNQTTASFNSCKIQAETRYTQGVIRQQQYFDRTVQTLDTKYARQYGIRR